MSNHYCSAKQITDLLACIDCGINQICCKECFAAKHTKQKSPTHKSCKLVDADVYKNFLRVVHVEWLVGQKVLKSLGGFGLVNNESKQYLANAAFYGSQFYRQFFTNEQSAQQYLVLKCYYSGNPQSFVTLAGLEKLLNEAKSLDIISKYISKLTEPSEQEKVMNSHIDFYTGADMYYLAEFVAEEQEIMVQRLAEMKANQEDFNIYKYIEWREKSDKPRNPTYYSNQFTAFLVEYYRKEPESKALWTLTDYILNYWQFFHTAVQINPTLKQFIESEVEFYHRYEQLMQQNSLNITYLGFKIWKLSNGVSQELPYLKNHYFLFAFVEGYLKMKIQRTYSFVTEDEKKNFAKQTWLDFVKYIKDYSLLLEEKNKPLSFENKKILQFDNYKTYYNYRTRLEPFHDLIKASKQNIYDKQVAVKFFNHYFESGLILKPKMYKDFFDKHQQEKRKQQQQLAKKVQSLKEELCKQENQHFYQFIYINFVAFCQQQQYNPTKQLYYQFKKNAMETMDEDYIKLTEEKFKRGDFNVLALEQEEIETQEQPEQKTEEPKVIIGQTGAKIVVGMDKYEEEILDENMHEDEESEEEVEVCPCCNDDYYNCESPQCQLAGYCMTCG